MFQCQVCNSDLVTVLFEAGNVVEVECRLCRWQWLVRRTGQ